MSIKRYLLKLFRGWLPKEPNRIRIRQFKPKILLLLAASVIIASILLSSFWQVIFPPPISTSPTSRVPQTGTTQYPWPMFHYDLRHTGYTESPAPKTNKTLWTHAIRGKRSSPAVADGVVYVGGAKGIYAMNATTGALVWIHETESDVESSPAVVDGVVYVGSRNHKVYALNASSGALIWGYTTGDEVYSSPAVADGTVYIGSNDNKVYALNQTTGTLIWNYTTGGWFLSSPAVADGVVDVLGEVNRLYLLNATTGGLMSNYTIGAPENMLMSSPVVADGVVYIGSDDHKVYALNHTTGTLIWNYTTGGWVESSPAIAYGVVYVGSGDSKVYALNQTTGALVWSYRTEHGVASSPAVADGVVYIGSWDFKVYALNATTGTLIWSYTTGLPIRSSPAVADGVVYVNSWDGRLYAFGELPPHYVVIKSVKASPTKVMAGLPVSITVVVKNEGTEPETFTVTTYYQWRETIAIGTKTVTNLAPGASLALKFSWNTMGAATNEVTDMWRWKYLSLGPGPVEIKAVVSTLTGEPINTLVDGGVTISFVPHVVVGIVAVAAIMAYFVEARKRAYLSVNLPLGIVFHQLMNYFKPKCGRKYYFSTEKVSTSHIEGEWHFGPFPSPTVSGYFKIDITSGDGKSQVKLRFSRPKSLDILASGCFIVGLLLFLFGLLEWFYLPDILWLLFMLCFLAMAFFFAGQWRTMDVLQEMKKFISNIPELVKEE